MNKSIIVIILLGIIIFGVGYFLNENNLSLTGEPGGKLEYDTGISCNSNDDCLNKYGSNWADLEGYCDVTCKFMDYPVEALQ